MFKVGASVDKQATAFCHLGAGHGDEAVGMQTRWRAKSAGIQNRGPKQPVKIDYVFANEMMQFAGACTGLLSVKKIVEV